MNVHLHIINPHVLEDQEDLEDLVDISVTLARNASEIKSDLCIELTIQPHPSGPKLNDEDPPACALSAVLKSEGPSQDEKRKILAYAYVWPNSTGTPIVIRILEPSIICDSRDGVAIECFCETLIGLFGLERPSLEG